MSKQISGFVPDDTIAFTADSVKINGSLVEWADFIGLLRDTVTFWAPENDILIDD